MRVAIDSADMFDIDHFRDGLCKTNLLYVREDVEYVLSIANSLEYKGDFILDLDTIVDDDLKVVSNYKSAIFDAADEMNERILQVLQWFPNSKILPILPRYIDDTDDTSGKVFLDTLDVMERFIYSRNLESFDFIYEPVKSLNAEGYLNYMAAGFNRSGYFPYLCLTKDWDEEFFASTGRRSFIADSWLIGDSQVIMRGTDRNAEQSLKSFSFSDKLNIVAFILTRDELWGYSVVDNATVMNKLQQFIPVAMNTGRWW